jgi:CBS domain-containing protein
MESPMKAKDIMTPVPVTIAPNASVMHAILLMLRHQISGLPVVAISGTLVGIVTESDFLRRRLAGNTVRCARWLELLIGSGKLADDYVQACGRKVYEIMSPEVFTAPEDASIADIAQIMERHRIRRVPIVCNQKLVGIITEADLVRAMARNTDDRETSVIDDASIRTRLTAELNRRGWSTSGLINVVVLNGVVQLWGVITEEEQRKAIRFAAENTSGAKAVEDHLMLVRTTAFAALMS